MEDLIPKPLADALEAGRGRYNAEFALARHRTPGLDPAAFSAHLRQTVAPITEAVFGVAPDRVREVVDVLYEFSLELVGKGTFERYPPVLQGWRELLVGLAACLAAEPRLFAGSVSNALHNLASTPGARAAQWIEGMLDLGYGCPDTTQVLEAGKVLAWKAGLAQYRAGALQVCRSLSPEIALSALGLGGAPPENLDRILHHLETDRWLTPEQAAAPGPRRLRVTTRAGAFRGFGGLFLRPPTVTSVGEELFVTDGEGCWSLHADAYGSVFQRVAQAPAGVSTPGGYRLVNGMVHAPDGQHGQFSQFQKAVSAAGTQHTLAVTVPHSHAVYLVACA